MSHYYGNESLPEAMARIWDPVLSKQEKLAQLGARVLEIQAEKLKMLRSGMPHSGVNHWVAGELFDAIRSLGLLDAPEAKQ